MGGPLWLQRTWLFPLYLIKGIVDLSVNNEQATISQPRADEDQFARRDASLASRLPTRWVTEFLSSAWSSPDLTDDGPRTTLESAGGPTDQRL